MPPAAFFHGLCLGVAADLRETERPTLTAGRWPGEEQVALKEDPTVCDGNNVRRDVSGNVARLRFSNRQCRHAAAAECIGKMRGTLQQTGMQVENVTRIRFTTRERSKSRLSARYAMACFERSSYTMRTSLPLIHEVLAEVRSRHTVRYCKEAESLADALTTMV